MGDSSRNSSLVDNGPAQVLVLQTDEVSLRTDRLVVAGGGHAEVFVEDDQVVAQVAAGSPDGIALLRAALTSPALRVHGDFIDAVVVSGGGWDRYVLSGDLEHRWLFTRHWDGRPDAPAVAIVGHAPSLQETAPDDNGSSGMPAGDMRLLAGTVGPPATVHVVNVFTRRVRQRSAIVGGPEDRRDDPGVVTDTLGGADAILAAWGGVPDAGMEAVDDAVAMLRACRDTGARVLVRARGGEIEMSGNPPQPSAHRTVRQDTRLVDAPAEWLWGGRLDG